MAERRVIVSGLSVTSCKYHPRREDCTSCTYFVAPHLPIVLPSLSLLWVALVVITIISYVGVFGKAFPVDSSPCVYLISFLARVS